MSEPGQRMKPKPKKKRKPLAVWIFVYADRTISPCNFDSKDDCIMRHSEGKPTKFVEAQ